MELIEKLQKIIEREIDNVPMVLTDPLTLRRLRAERLAQAALTAIMDAGDGVQEVDVGWATSAAQHLCAPPDRDCAIRLLADAFARHRALAFAAGKAARDREIVEWLREDHGDWSAAARKFADAIERGEV